MLPLWKSQWGGQEKGETSFQFDLSSVPPGKWLSTLLSLCDQLESHETLEITSCLDPEDLFIHLRSLRPGTLVTDFMKAGPEQWMVQIRKT